MERSKNKFYLLLLLFLWGIALELRRLSIADSWKSANLSHQVLILKFSYGDGELSSKIGLRGPWLQSPQWLGQPLELPSFLSKKWILGSSAFQRV